MVEGRAGRKEQERREQNIQFYVQSRIVLTFAVVVSHQCAHRPHTGADPYICDGKEQAEGSGERGGAAGQGNHDLDKRDGADKCTFGQEGVGVGVGVGGDSGTRIRKTSNTTTLAYIFLMLSH